METAAAIGNTRQLFRLIKNTGASELTVDGIISEKLGL